MTSDAMRVEQAEPRHDRVDRHDEDRDREHLRDEEDHHQLAPAREVEAGQRVAGGRRHEDAQQHGERGDDDRVQHPAWEVRLGQHEPVVVQRRLLDQRQLAALDPAPRA